MAYATAQELWLLLRRPDQPFTADEEATAELLLDLAGGAVEEECGQSLESSTTTALLDADGGARLILPRWPVTAVASVTLADTGDVLTHGPAADYTWSAAGILYRRGTCWPHGPQAVDVAFTAGHAPVPTGVRGIVLRLAKGAWDNPERLSAESLGDHSVTYASAEAAGMDLSEADRRVLYAYRARM
jgi:hypothetical protein